MEDSEIVKATSFYECFKMVEFIILLHLLPMFGESTFFGSFLSRGSHVIESCEEATRLGCDDGNRESPSEMMEDESLLSIRDWTTLK